MMKIFFFCRNVTTGALLYCTCNWLVSSLAGQCSEDVLGMQSSFLIAFAFSLTLLSRKIMAILEARRRWAPLRGSLEPGVDKR